MKRKNRSSIIDTKEELIKNFSREQMEIYNYHKSKFSYINPTLYPVISEDKELRFLENGCNILEKIFKFEVVVALIIGTVIVMSNGLPTKNDSTVNYKQEIASVEYDVKF